MKKYNCEYRDPSGEFGDIVSKKIEAVTPKGMAAF